MYITLECVSQPKNLRDFRRKKRHAIVKDGHQNTGFRENLARDKEVTPVAQYLTRDYYTPLMSLCIDDKSHFFKRSF
jgi:hypothetical protein